MGRIISIGKAKGGHDTRRNGDGVHGVRSKWHATEGFASEGEQRRGTRGPYLKQNTRPRDVSAKRKGFMENWGIS